MNKDTNYREPPQDTGSAEPGARQNQGSQSRKIMIQDNPYSGNMVLTFFDDNLEARADFIPPIGVGEPLTVTRVQGFLKQLNILYGIQEEAIQQGVIDCTCTKQPVKDVLIARGDPPVNEVAEYFQINPCLFAAPPEGITDQGRIDYRERSPFIIVKKNQALAQIQPRITGKPGRTVHNTPIPYKTIYPEGVIGGSHTRTDEKFIIAEINGQFIQEKNLLHVQDRLIIKGAVGYGTGNITFPGDVIIDGPVSDGFTIYAEGSVTIKQTFDVTEVIAKGDLNVSGGIIGRGRAIVKVGGSIRTRFIENCHIACKKTVTVESAIINSTVFAMEQIDLGEKGFIIGSDITAIHRIRAGTIGKKAGKSAKLHCGIDFTIQQEIERSNTRFQFLGVEIKKIQDLIAASGGNPERQAKLKGILRQNEEQQQQLERRISALLEQTNADENATVEVYGEITPGTLIEVCQIALFVADPLRRVRIKLDKFLGKLLPQPF